MSNLQNQTVVVTRMADRHADHSRDFAESTPCVVVAGDLSEVLTQVASQVSLAVGRYSISVSEPWDAE